MITNPEPAPAEVVECEVCLKEIPRSAAQSAEVRDYVVYFCGPKCYEEWAEEQSEEHTRETGEP
jgi:YHS domain-containing protein